MPKFEVVKSAEIKAPAEKVYGLVRDFHQWPAWSPWFIADPDCKLEYGSDGQSYAWDGKITGSGMMEVVGEEPGRSIDHKLTFLKPWKSVAAVRFEFEGQEGTQNVTWRMDSSIPFFMFWMKGTLTAMVGMDYERGLTMLKDLAETDAVSSRLDYPGEAPFKGFSYVAVRTACSMSEIGPRMKADADRLGAWLGERDVTPSGHLFAAYHKWDIKKNNVGYTLGYPVTKKPDSIPAEFVAGELKDCRTYRVQHTGPYHHLGNAWSSGMMRARSKLFRQDKSIHPFEVYENDPDQVPAAEVVTTVHFPVK